MIPSLILDMRLVLRQQILGAVAVLTVVGCAVTGTLVLSWPIVAAWIAVCGQSHRDLAPLGRTGALQSVLGIPRRRAVLTRYANVLLITAGLAVLGAVIALVWAVLGRDLAQVWGYFGVLVFALVSGLLNLTLGYVASPVARQLAGVSMVLVIIAVAVVPNYSGQGSRWSTDALVEALYAGPVPVVLLAGLVAVATLVLGSRAAIRAHERAIL